MAERLLDSSYSFLGKSPKPHPDSVYPSGVQAAMPEPTEQLTSALSVQMTRAEKDVLDLVSAWPLCTREQLAGLMGGVTLRRVNQVRRSLTQHGLVRTDEPLHMLTDEGLTYLARRDRAAVGLTLDRWSAEPLYLNADVYAGTAVRALASQLRHHAGVVGFAVALSAEVARSPDHDLFDVLPISRSSIGYRYDWTTYVIHPDASFTLEYKGRWRPYLLEFERRATTPKRARSRLKSYRRYFDSGWAERDHEGRPPGVLFVFESLGSGNAFLDVADTAEGVPIITSNAKSLAKRGILGDAWILPPPHSLDRRPLSLMHQGGTMTTNSVPTTSCRGCPSMAAGTIFRPFATPLASSALPTANWCRFDASGDVPHTRRPTCLSASGPSYSSSTQQPGEHRLEGHRSMDRYPPQSVPTTSCRGTKGQSYTYGVSPQQVET